MISPSIKFKTPLLIEYGLTPYCNANCVFCLNHWRSQNINFIENWYHIKKICDQFILADVFDVYLTGGEPTCSKYFSKTIKYLHKRNISVSLSTNGLYVTSEQLEVICKYVDKIGISIHGISDNKLDKIMNVKHSFHKLNKFLEKLESLGVSYSLNYTIYNDNFDDLDKVLNFVSKKYKNISSFNVNRVSLVGSAFVKHICLPKKKQIKLFKMIKKYNHKFYFDVDLADVGPYCYTKIKQKPCGAGFSFTFIDPWGNNMLCIMNNKPFGNILKTDLTKLWHTKSINKLRSLSWLPKKCKSCKFIDFCQGGCKFSQSEFSKTVPYATDILLSNNLR